MEGIIVLNTTKKEVHSGSLINFGTVIGILVFLFALVLFFYFFCYGDFQDFVCGSFFIVLAFFVTYRSYFLSGEIIGYNYIYEVTFDNDKIDFEEFNEKYKIITHRGLIYTIEDRNTYLNK